MKVRKFNVDRTKRGVIVTVKVEFEADIKINTPMHLDYVTGFTDLDNEKLQGKLPFEVLIINTSLLKEKHQAKKAAYELRTLLQDLDYKEAIELNNLLEVEQYLKKEFQDYISTPSKE